MRRDLTGYGGNWPDFCWPNGQRLAVSIVLNSGEGAEQQVGDGDPQTDRMGGVMSVVGEGRRNLGQEQIFAYGTRAGILRLADCLARDGAPATIFFCGRAAERSPALARMLVAQGHEPACRGWRWRPHADYDSAETAAADLDRAAAAIEAATGERPLAFSAADQRAPGPAACWSSAAICMHRTGLTMTFRIVIRIIPSVWSSPARWTPTT